MAKLQCKSCGNSFPTKMVLLEHMDSEHGLRCPPFPCLQTECRFVSTTRTACHKHMRKNHGIKVRDNRMKRVLSFTCRFCVVPNLFATKLECSNHEASWHSAACSTCDFTCESSEKLEHHIESSHSEGGSNKSEVKAPTIGVFCEQCGKRFASKHGLKEHSELHEDNFLVCDQCEKTFKGTLNLKRHIKAYHTQKRSNQIFQCHYCEHKSKNRRAQQRHIGMTHEEKKFKCGQCGRGFILSYLLKKHTLSVHTKETPFRCKYECGKAFNDFSNRRMHERTVHEGKPRLYSKKAQ